MITMGKCFDQILNSFRKCMKVLEPLLQITRGTKTNYVIIWTGQAANSAVNHLCEQFTSYVSRTRINCPAVHVLCKPRLFFSRVNVPNETRSRLGGQFFTQHCMLSTQALIWCLCSRKCRIHMLNWLFVAK